MGLLDDGGYLSGRPSTIQYRFGQGNTVLAGNTSAVTLSNHTVSDLVVAIYAHNGTSDVTVGLSTAGYTKLYDLYSNDTYDVNLGVFYKVLASAEANVANTAYASAHGTIMAMIFRGVDTTTPILYSASATGIDTMAPTPPALYTPKGSVLVTIGVGSASTNYGVTPPIDFNYVTHSYTVSCGMAYKDITNSKLSTPVVWTPGSDNVANSWCAASIVLNPAVPLTTQGIMSLRGAYVS